MVVQHNLTAVNANRMLGLTTTSQAKSTEKLSSGYKINRAADDAAGLAISEKMRKQVRGLTQATANAQDGISAVQTAEGALAEVHDMLQRMNELAIKAANGTMSSDDRQNVQDEIDAIVEEIDRVSTTTKFNEIYLLKGDESKGTETAYAYKKTTVPASFEATDAAQTAGTKFYAKDGTAELDADAAIAELAAGKKIYTTAKVAQTAATTQPSVTAGTKAKSVATFTDAWGTNAANNTITVGGKEYAGSTTLNTLSAVKDAIQNDLGEDWVVSCDESAKTITIEAANSSDTAVTVSSSAIAITGAKSGGTDATVTPTNGTANSYSDTSGTFYLEGGKEALTEEQVKAALKEALDSSSTAPTFYTDAAVDQTAAKAGTDYEYTPAERKTAMFYDANGKEVAASDIAGKLADGETFYTDKSKKTAVTDANVGDYTKPSTYNAALSFKLHVGSESDSDNRIEVSIESMSAAGLGVFGLDVSTEDDATSSINTLTAAIKQVSSQRSALGAIQNRLEHTVNNLGNVVENTTSAESQIRDTDMATEMVKYANNNILAQAGQSMLAQANQSNQGILSLLG